ncbi:MAG: hypothetical protein DRJ42_05335 [Deltaproteobacteria bacterium]|nr:MAG: hypothetical protein DRJ42_05335 [Deltaproteobacteria bacterium]
MSLPQNTIGRFLCPLLIAVPGLIAGGCTATPEAPPSEGPVYEARWENLAPVTDNTNIDLPAQPDRAHPYAVAMSPDGEVALVTLRGSEVSPGHEVVVIDVPGRRLVRRLTVGARPVAVGIRPQNDYAVVLSHLSPMAAVIDLATQEVTGQLRVGHYAENLAFSSDGRRMYVSNRATDEVERWEVRVSEMGLTATRHDNVPAGVNPGAIGIAETAGKIYVADAGGLGLRVFDMDSMEELGFIPLNAPVFDVASMGGWIVATTLNGTSGLPCPSDADYPGEEGDGIFAHITDTTCGRGFADIQNEVAFIDTEYDLVAVRYTSDTAEVSEADREGDHDPELQKVVGALPFGIAVAGPGRAFVSMGSSFEVTEMVVEGEMGSGAPPTMEMPQTWATDFAPRGVAVDADGRTLVVANMLGETVSILDVSSGERTDIEVGDTTNPFPATSAEIGELFFNSSAYSSDGDQSCSHCHPDADSDGKSWGVGLVRAYGRRATMVIKNLHDTAPLLIEGVFEETDFTVEMEAMAFRPDFHDSSYALQVSLRDEYFQEVSHEMLERNLGFDEMAAHVADYLVAETRLLPSPFPDDTPEAERGHALFFRPDVGCANCHPPPSFASPDNFTGVTTMARFDRPRRDLDPDVSTKYIEEARDGFFNANSLRGTWDRRGVFFHDGRARTLRETVLTPGHACLEEGERAFNESEGRVDTNGGVSHLTCSQIDDLIAFIISID